MTATLTKKTPSSTLLKRVNADTLASWANRPIDSTIICVLSHFLIAQPSQNTRRAYGRDIHEFLNFCLNTENEIKRIEEISERLILLWRDSLNKKHSKFDESSRRVTSSSVARKLCSLASMIEFSLQRKLITLNPFEHISRPRVRRQSHASILSSDEIQSILNSSKSKLLQLRSAQDSHNSKLMRQLMKAELEWCILVLLFTVGMRVSELCALKLKDISREGDLIRLHLMAKGGQQHNPLIHPDTAHVLLQFISRAHPMPQLTDPLFPAVRKCHENRPHQSIHRSHVFRIVQNAARAAGISRPFSPHGCRATLATQLHLSQVPVVEIQALLNHSQVTTTQLYLHRVHELREAAALQLPWSVPPISRPLNPKAE